VDFAVEERAVAAAWKLGEAGSGGAGALGGWAVQSVDLCVVSGGSSYAAVTTLELRSREQALKLLELFKAKVTVSLLHMPCHCFDICSRSKNLPLSFWQFVDGSTLLLSRLIRGMLRGEVSSRL
jgi:hypothetical protein